MKEAEPEKKPEQVKESERNVEEAEVDASKFSVTVTSSSGSSETVEKFDTVNVHYHGTLLNGDVFDSSYDRGQPLKF